MSVTPSSTTSGTTGWKANTPTEIKDRLSKPADSGGAAPENPPAEKSTDKVEVKSGDTIWAIARAVESDPDKAQKLQDELIKQNGGSTLIRPGQVLNINGGGGAQNNNNTGEQNPPVGTGGAANAPEVIARPVETNTPPEEKKNSNPRTEPNPEPAPVATPAQGGATPANQGDDPTTRAIFNQLYEAFLRNPAFAIQYPEAYQVLTEYFETQQVGALAGGDRPLGETKTLAEVMNLLTSLGLPQEFLQLIDLQSLGITQAPGTPKGQFNGFMIPDLSQLVSFIQGMGQGRTQPATQTPVNSSFGLNGNLPFPSTTSSFPLINAAGQDLSFLVRGNSGFPSFGTGANPLLGALQNIISPFPQGAGQGNGLGLFA